MLRKFIAAAAFAMLACAAVPSQAQPVKIVSSCGTVSPAFATTTTSGVLVMDVNGQLCIAGTFSATGGTISNATSGQATTATNQGAVSYLYGFNGTTWDQLQVDASKFLKINCVTGCAGGTFNNNADNVATSATNGQSGVFNYVWDGAAWDRLYGDSTNGAFSHVKAWGGTALGAPSAYGTSPGAVNVPGVNAFVTNTNANGQAALASSSPVAIAKNSGTGSTVAGAAVGTAGTSSTEVVSVQGVSGGTPASSSIDPCNDALTVKSFLPITATTSLVKVIATGTAAKKLYICQIILTTTAANNVAVFEATTATTCATAAVAVYGAGTSVATAANGFPFPANGGVSLGNGLGTVGQTTVNNNDLCIGTSAATPLTGGITYATK